MARSDPSFAALSGFTPSPSLQHQTTTNFVESNRVPLRPEGGLKRKIFRLLGIGTNRKHTTFTTKDITPPPPTTTTSPEKRRKSRILGLGGSNNHDSNRDSERLQHVRASKIRQPLDTGDAGSINFSTTSLQNSERTGGGAVSPVVGAAGGVGAGGAVGGGEHLPTDSTTVDHELGQFDSATTSNTSSHSPIETAQSNKPPSTMSENTAATSFSHTTRPISATPILLPPHSPASPTAPSSLHPRMTDDASVLTLASSSKHIRRRNSLDTNASMLAIAPSSRRDSQESMPELDSSEASISGARRSVGSVLSSKFEGGRARSVATGHSVRMGEEDEEMETGDDDDIHSTGRDGEKTEKEGLA